MTSHVIHTLGAYLGEDEELLPPGQWNPAGYWERRDICLLHERMLSALYTDWDTSCPLPGKWHLSGDMAPFREELVDLIRTKFAHRRLWAWKDPRTSLLLPLWTDVLGELGIQFGCLWVTRNPLDVARSLQRRDGFALDDALGIWVNYNLSIWHNTRGLPRALIAYDHLLEDWEGTLGRCAKALSLSPTGAGEQTRKAIDEAIRTNLRHSVSKIEDLTGSGCPASVHQLALILEAVARTGNLEQASVKAKMDRLLDAHMSLWNALPEKAPAAQVGRTRRSPRAADFEHQDAQKLAVEHAALQEKVEHSLRLLVNEKDRRLMDVWRRLEHAVEEREQARSQAADKDVQIAALQEHLAGLERVVAEEREQARSQAADKDVQIAALHERVAGLERVVAEEREQARSQAADKDVQIAALQERLAGLERVVAEERQRSTAQAEEIVRMQVRLEENLRQLTGLRREASVLSAELTVSRDQLDQARSEVEALTRSVSDVHASGSWRVTRPLRLVYGVLRTVFLRASRGRKTHAGSSAPS